MRPAVEALHHYVPRAGLTKRLAAGPVGLVWAGGGCGKTALAREFRAAVAAAAIEVRLEPGDGGPDRLVGRLRRALRRAGRSDLLAAMSERLEDPGSAMEALLDSLAVEPEAVLLIVDDVQHANEDSQRLLAQLAEDLSGDHRLLLVGRGPPPGLEALSQLPGAVTLGTAELAFTSDEIVDLARRQAGLALAPTEADGLRHATGGWAAATALGVHRLAKADDRRAELGELTEQSSVLSHLVGELLASLSEPERRGAVQLAHLPLITPELGNPASGGKLPDLVRAVTAAGIPLARVHQGWWEFSGGVQEFLAALAPLEPEVARAAADVYLEAGETRAALTVLLRADLSHRMAEVLSDLPPGRLDRFEHAELGAFIDALPASAIDAFPRLLLHYARACEPAAQLRARAAALARAEAVAADRGGPMGREIAVERARDLARDERSAEAEALATEVLVAAGEEELATRARALDVLGRIAALRGDDEGLRQAQTLLEASLVLCRGLDQRSWAAQALLALADRVLYARGQHDLAVDCIDELLAGLGGRRRYRAVTLTVRAAILVDCGRFVEAETTLSETRELVDATGDERAAAYLAWTAAQLASARGEVEATLTALREVEEHRGDWFDEHSTGAEFLADAADLCSRIGEAQIALEYLARARLQPVPDPLAILIAEAAVIARSGEPSAARLALDAVERHPRLPARERWRIDLLRAYAALRADSAEAEPLASRAFDRAAALGSHPLPLVRERDVAERLLPLAGRAGSAGAMRLAAEQPALEVNLLGTFEVRRAGRPVALPEGRPRTLVKLIAASGGRLGTDEAIEALWPAEAADGGRRGLRNVLHRLRGAAGEILVREGDTVRLPRTARVDAIAFEREGTVALAGGIGGRDETAARRALAGYRGDLLPDDRDAQWASEPRARVEELHLRLLDMVAEEVEGRGELDEAVRFLERAIDADPSEERRYLLVARILIAQGRRAKAAKTIERGAEELRAIGLPVPAAFTKLAESIRRGRQAPGDSPDTGGIELFPPWMPWHAQTLGRALTMR